LSSFENPPGGEKEGKMEIDLRENIMAKVPVICKEEKVDINILRPPPRDGPGMPEEIKKIREKIYQEYIALLQRVPFHIIKDFYDDDRGYSEKVILKVKEAVERSFEGALKRFLQAIKDEYQDKPEVWQERKEKKNDRPSNQT
jgi:hypothetical protein